MGMSCRSLVWASNRNLKVIRVEEFINTEQRSLSKNQE